MSGLRRRLRSEPAKSERQRTGSDPPTSARVGRRRGAGRPSSSEKSPCRPPTSRYPVSPATSRAPGQSSATNDPGVSGFSPTSPPKHRPRHSSLSVLVATSIALAGTARRQAAAQDRIERPSPPDAGSGVGRVRDGRGQRIPASGPRRLVPQTRLLLERPPGREKQAPAVVVPELGRSFRTLSIRPQRWWQAWQRSGTRAHGGCRGRSRRSDRRPASHGFDGRLRPPRSGSVQAGDRERAAVSVIYKYSFTLAESPRPPLPAQ